MSASPPSPQLVLGPMLRWVGRSEATIWVETDAACEVEACGARARTFRVGDHHYALVQVDGLGGDAAREYAVALDGHPRWPPPGSEHPPSTIRPLRDDGRLTLAFGSCRVAVPHAPPYTLTKDEDPEGKELDALYALALRMMGQDPRLWPQALILLGDQVYADEGSPRAREFIRGRRDPGVPPGLEACDFEEYTHLYRESWQDPVLRWLLSTVPSAMIFDDHEVHDDWNTSEAWLREIEREPWWRERVIGAYMSYWIYQHIGNLSPRELAGDRLWQEVRAAPDDAESVIRASAAHSAKTPDGSRWSFHRDLGRTRLVMVDSRGGRVLRDRRRAMVDEDEWAWIVDHARGDVDHLLIGTSLPLLLAPGMHDFEAWSEAVCAGAWGGVAARLGERVRRALDLEHWAAFGESFERMVELIAAVGAGERGRPPASIVVLGGDVHHAYLAEVGFRRSVRVQSRVYQAVCSPFRNPLDARERRVIRFATSRAATLIGRVLAGLAGVPRPPVRWRFADRPVFDNQVAILDIEGDDAWLRVERTLPDEPEPRLETSFDRRLA